MIHEIFLQGFVKGGPGVEDGRSDNMERQRQHAGGTNANIAVSLDGPAIEPSAGTAQTPTNPLP